MVTMATLIKNRTEGTRISRSLVEMIESLPEGKYRIIIEPQSVHHSVPQRKLLFMWLSLLGREAEDMPSVSQMTSAQLTHFMHEIEADVAGTLGFTLPIPEDGDEFIAFLKDYKDK